MENKLSNQNLRFLVYQDYVKAKYNNGTSSDPYLTIADKLIQLNHMYEINDNIIVKTIYDYVIEIGFLDTWKILNDKILSNNLSEEDLLLSEKINNIRSFEDLISEVENNQTLLSIFCKNIVDFYKMNPLKKIEITKKINLADYHFLKHEFSNFYIDYNEFNSNVDVNVNLLANFYSSYLNIYDSMAEDDEEIDGEKSRILMNQIMGFLKNMYAFDKDSYELCMKEIIIQDYKWLTYFTKNKFYYDLIMQDECDYRTFLVESNNLDELVEETVWDEDYFNSLIDSMILTSCDNMYLDEDIISKEKVDEYCDENLSKEVKKKLTIR